MTDPDCEQEGEGVDSCAIPADLVELHEVLEWQAAVAVVELGDGGDG